MAEPGHGPDRDNQPSRFASMTNWVRSWKTLQWGVGSNPDRDTENMDSRKTVVLAALGRPFSLGMLYDCRNDSLITALTLWNREALEKEADERPQHNSEFEILASDSIKDKSSALNVEASLQASFLCGLVDLEGSAKFLLDSKSSINQARVVLNYKTTTKFKELSMNHIGRGNVKHPYVFESGQATHVVTGILYGAQAFFVFDRELSQKEDRQDIEGNLKVLIQKIPKLKIDGQGSLNMAGKDKVNVDKFNCKFYGDFKLKKPPVSFQDAIEVYQSLPELLGTNGENAVPLKVWLLPLKALDSAAAQLVRQISDRLVRDAQNVLEDLNELERRCKDVECCTTTKQFHQVSKKVKAFKKLIFQHKDQFQNIMARKLPLIRGGGEEESVLAEILKKIHSSPFESGELNKWMDCKEKEIKIISSLIDKMPNMIIVASSDNTLQSEIHSGDVRHTVCFVFTSLEGPEPYLSALSNYLDETQPDDVPCAYDVEKEQWFSSNVTYEKMQLFKDFAEANKENKRIRFLATAISDDEKKGATLHLYKDGSLPNYNFEPPSKPEMNLGDITHNSVTLNISPPRVGLTPVTHYTVEFCVHGDDVWHQQMESKAGDVTVSGLKINEGYQFRCRAWCAVGLGPACEGSPLIKTLPSSPPEKLQVDCYSTELSVSWEKPSELGSGAGIKQYILEYAETSLEVNPEECIWSKLTITANDSQLVKVIPGLQPSTGYIVRVRCDCGVFGLGKEDSVVVCTKKLSDGLATSIRASSREKEPGSPSVFKIPLKKNIIRIDGCESYTFGEDSARPNRTLMFLGATGSGKSTLINGMVNYVLGIDWKDSFRFKLINEDQSKSQAESQTTHVTTYKINHQDGFKVPYSLTLVDTPGFGDTRGLESDKAITEQIWSLFTSAKGVFEMDAICFVTQASQVRLTASQRYMFDSVLSIFGKDVAENICILVTFADGQQPPVLEAINAAKVPCPKTNKDLPVHHKFNNSALFAENESFSDRADQDSKSSKYLKEKKTDVNNFDAMCWAMGASSMETFFTALGQMTTKSLQLTKEVLNERKRLEDWTLEGLLPQMAVDRGKTVVLAALGRPFSLGMLYDCRNDSLIPALTLWDRDALEKDTDERTQPNSNFEIVASDSIEDKSSALNVEASLKASFLCGLVEIEGSAKFLSDSKISRNQARVTLKYKTTTKFQQLSMNHIGRGNAKHPYVFEKGLATHVVTGILYGAQAFFVFDREVSEKEDRQDIEGNLKVLIKKIPTLKIDGQGSLNMADTGIANVDKFSCKFHGDFNLEKHPVSFHEAIEVYQSLPKLMGTNGANAVPQKVWLMPLKDLDSAAAQLVRQISDRLVRDAQNFMEDLSELERRCNDAEKCTTAQQFPQINKKLKALKCLVSQYKLEFQNIMARKLPLIRGGGEDESVLANILKKVHSSPFKSGELNEWMESKETEIKLISSLIDKMPNMTIVTSRGKLYHEIHSGDITYAVCFVFTSLETPEPYLSALFNYLVGQSYYQTQPDDVPCAYDVAKEPWFFSNDVMDKLKEKVKLFKDFAEANKENNSIRFLTAATSDDEKKGATLHLYKDGSLVTDNFEPPSKPEMIIRDITHNSVTLNISPPRFGFTTVNHYTVEFCVDGGNVWHQQIKNQAGDVTVSGLQINEEYVFRCRAKCAVGFGPACVAFIETLPVKNKAERLEDLQVIWMIG